jgi:multimeric flavodoxin WrbA
MFVLGLQGSPRKGGNTDTFLAAFLESAARAGAVTQTVQTARAGVAPCKGCGYCEKHGTCVIADDPMSRKIFGWLRQADLVVAATPVYFYGISGQLKILIDRCQTLWSRKYVYKLKDPLAAARNGLLFSVAASRGRQLFDGIHLTAKYFFDAIDARMATSITYRGVEAKGAIRKREGWQQDIEEAVEKLVAPAARREKILFVSRHGACLAPMAAALAQRHFGDRIRTDFAGDDPAEKLHEPMVRAMQRKGLDLGYRRPQSTDAAFMGVKPDKRVILEASGSELAINGAEALRWSLARPAATDDASMDRLANEIDEKIAILVDP